ncbi:MAG TPA: transglutaminase family protein [Terriglobales bacterium]|nr:transglutaminase family protein [Terriglobales bacterium]
MIYSIRHITNFLYEPAVRESVMEVRVQPRNEAQQRCLTFYLDVNPQANVMWYRDFLGNTVHHFDIPAQHTHVKVTAQALVEVQPVLFPTAADSGNWQDLDAQIAAGDFWEMLLPSRFACPTDLLQQFAQEHKIERDGSPLATLFRLNETLYEAFDYVPKSTKVDSPIDDALRSRQGVCQDFAHIMIALVRQLRIPCRYVSGYLFHGKVHGVEAHDRSSEGATHAWVEAFVPGPGWVGLDPTNNILGCDRHIRVAIGRDYADVPPTRGVYKGGAQNELSVAVTVGPSDLPLPEEMPPATVFRTRPAAPTISDEEAHKAQQQ